MAYDEDEFLEDDYSDDLSIGNYDYDEEEHVSMDDLEEDEDYYEMDDD
jgi:hypothetical protein